MVAGSLNTRTIYRSGDREAARELFLQPERSLKPTNDLRIAGCTVALMESWALAIKPIVTVLRGGWFATQIVAFVLRRQGYGSSSCGSGFPPPPPFHSS